MRRLLVAFLTLIYCAASVPLAAQNAVRPSTAPQGDANSKPAVKRAPVFRSTKEQIKQAQALLKTRGFYDGQGDGKLNDDTRAALRKYQEAEGLKITGTLNKVTLERMGIVLTDRQKEWKPAT
ncbi:MAG: N-acetylmuramoyl-L-alanine amidase [Pyrinomonadaceae bacterium]|nr:N-acetylmuramoyl-L-alanine amidase [Pyrinomonadaceae bacterium]